MEFNKLIVGFVLFSLFSILTLNFIVKLGALNEIDVSDIGGGALDISAFNQSIDGVTDDAQSLRQQFESGDIDNLESATGIKGIGESMINFIFTPFQLVSQIAENILGVPQFVIDIMLTLLILGIILSLWALFKIGR